MYSWKHLGYKEKLRNFFFKRATPYLILLPKIIKGHPLWLSPLPSDWKGPQRSKRRSFHVGYHRLHLHERPVLHLCTIPRNSLWQDLWIRFRLLQSHRSPSLGCKDFRKNPFFPQSFLSVLFRRLVYSDRVLSGFLTNRRYQLEPFTNHLCPWNFPSSPRGLP